MKKLLLTAVLACVASTCAMAKHPVLMECKAPTGEEATVRGNNYTVGLDRHDGKQFSEALRYRSAPGLFRDPNVYNHDDLQLTTNLGEGTLVVKDADGKTIAYACSVGVQPK